MSEPRIQRESLNWLDAVLVCETKENEKTTFRVEFSSPYGGDFVELPITGDQSVSLVAIHGTAELKAKDSPYWDADHHEHKLTVQRVADLSEEAYPNEVTEVL